MALNHSFEHISEIGKGLDVVELGRGEERSDNGPAIAAAVRAGEQMVLAAERNRPVILPMSGRRSRFIIAGTHSMGAASGVSVASSAQPDPLFTSRRPPAWSLWPRRGYWILPPALEWRLARRAWWYQR